MTRERVQDKASLIITQMVDENYNSPNFNAGLSRICNQFKDEIESEVEQYLLSMRPFLNTMNSLDDKDQNYKQDFLIIIDNLKHLNDEFYDNSIKKIEIFQINISNFYLTHCKDKDFQIDFINFYKQLNEFNKECVLKVHVTLIIYNELIKSYVTNEKQQLLFDDSKMLNEILNSAENIYKNLDRVAGWNLTKKLMQIEAMDIQPAIVAKLNAMVHTFAHNTPVDLIAKLNKDPIQFASSIKFASRYIDFKKDNEISDKLCKYINEFCDDKTKENITIFCNELGLKNKSISFIQYFCDLMSAFCTALRLNNNVKIAKEIEAAFKELPFQPHV